jgi:site-specific DNA-methyltransferase (adenine-specific)
MSQKKITLKKNLEEKESNSSSSEESNSESNSSSSEESDSESNSSSSEESNSESNSSSSEESNSESNSSSSEESERESNSSSSEENNNKTFVLNDIKIYNEDCLDVIEKFEDNSIDCVITDPPYFLDKLDNNWDSKKIKKDKANSHITHLPKGMKFDKDQVKKLYEFYLKLSVLLYKKLKPGGFFLSFSSPRLYHAIAMATEIAGFEIRDMINWVYSTSMPKGMSVARSIKTLKVSSEKKDELLEFYSNFKTPMIKSCFEPICVATKPRVDTYLNNELNFKTGLIDFSHKVGDNKVPANIITTEPIIDFYDKNFIVNKETKKEKGKYNTHLSVKPLKLIEHLLLLFSKKDSVVLDPFLGSGTTALACKNTGRKHIGIEMNKDYYEICKKRLQD